MGFPSFEYLVFFPIAALLYWYTPARLRWLTLVATGLACLWWASPVHAAVAIALTLANYLSGLGLARWEDTRKATWALWCVLAFDVAVLSTFKYGGALFHSNSWFVPIGISYYAFQLIGYNLEIYWGREPVERHFGRLVASIVFFPKLLAGPIERPHHFLRQLATPPAWNVSRLVALRQIGWGLFKKCVIADRIARVINPIYAEPRTHTGLTLLIALVLYTVQIYNDFSGYTDIALGSARILGIDLMPNFNRPFSATSITDFWRRWHISLSSWTNDYIYRPLSMFLTRNTPLKKAGVVAAVLIAFIVLGAWHGPNVTFVVFGLIHGLAVCVEALTPKLRISSRWPRATARLSNVLTITFYTFSTVFFRARTVGDALYVIGHCLRGVGDAARVFRVAPAKYDLLILAVIFGVMAARKLATRMLWPLDRQQSTSRWLLTAIDYAIVASIVVLGVFDVNTFVYSQF